MSSLPQFRKFDINDEPTSIGTRWKAWLVELENLLLALNITDKKRQRALMLYYAGRDTLEIYKTLLPDEDPDEDFEEAKQRLTSYFEPKVNKSFEIYHFRRLKQGESDEGDVSKNETIDAFVTRLRQKATRCDFHDKDAEIKYQIIFGCRASRLRQEGLKNDSISLTDLVSLGRSYEVVQEQAKTIEKEIKPEEVYSLRAGGKYSQRRSIDEKAKLDRNYKTEQTAKKCFFCGGIFPHPGGRKQCPAFGKKCHKCSLLHHLSSMCMKKSVRKIMSEPNTEIESEGSDDEYVYQISESEYKQPENVIKAVKTEEGKEASRNAQVVVKVEKIPITADIDTGASCNILDEHDFKRIKNSVKLTKTSAKIFAFNSTTPLDIKGQFEAMVETRNRIMMIKFYVIKGNRRLGAILGLKASEDLGLVRIIKRVDENEISFNCENTEINKMLHEYEDLFKGIGCMKDIEVKLDIDDSVQPKAQKHRRIPFHLREKVEEELKRLHKAKVIETVNEATGWVSPVVIANKSDGTIRLCVDMTEANKAIRRVHHVIPTIDEIKCEVNGASVFSKLDLNKGYHQLELSPDSRNITTFSTHAGLARFRRLNFGTKSAAEIFHEEIRKKVHSIKGVINIHDDILVFGESQKLHDEALKNTLDTLKTSKLTLNRNKCEFSKPKIKFYGLIFSEAGIVPDNEKVETLKACEAPANKSELRSFLGMTNFSATFIENYSQKTSSLRELLHNDVKWRWTEKHERDFQRLKKSLAEECLLRYFNPSLETEIICDGSPLGVGCVLTQIDNVTGKRNIIQYASRSLTKAESNYSQIEREAMAILFGCMKFRMYLLGKPFKIITDHLPLVSMFNKPKSQMPYRVERVRLKLQGFQFTVLHMPGKQNPTDYVSRHPLNISEIDANYSRRFEGHVHTLLRNKEDSAINLKDIKDEIDHDETLLELKLCINKGYIDKDNSLLKPYMKIFNELSLCDGIIMKGDKVVLPERLVNQVISAAHEGHQGIIKTKQLLRSRVWCPGVDKKVELFISKCRGCQVAVVENYHEPLKMSELPDGPWQHLATDLHGPTPSGDYVLVVIDEYSRFPEIDFVKSTSPKCIIPKLDRILASFGIPLIIKSDNGSPYNSGDFEKYVRYMGIKHRRITPYYPKANGLVENFNRMIEKVIHTSHVEGTNWKQELFKFMMNYRATPHITTGRAPADLLFQKRSFRVRIPQVMAKIDDIELRRKDKTQKDKTKYYADRKATVKDCNIQTGDTVLVKQRRLRKQMPYYDPVPYRVMTRKGNMITASRKDKTITRNSAFYKKIPSENPERSGGEKRSEKNSMIIGHSEEPLDIPEEVINRDEDTIDESLQVPWRSTRVRGEPVRYPMDVC